MASSYMCTSEWIIVDVRFASIHYSKYGHAHPLSDHILATKKKKFHPLLSMQVCVEESIEVNPCLHLGSF